MLGGSQHRSGPTQPADRVLEVAGVEGGIVMLRIADNVRIRIAKSAIAGLEGEPSEGSRK